MSDEFSSHSGIKWNGHVGEVQYGGGDRSMICLFFNKAVQNPNKSLEQGRPMYEDKVYVRIHPPGERLNIVERPMREDDKRRWPMQWMQFQENRQQVPDGTPVDLLYPDQPSVAAMLRASNVYTIEQCAELSANAIESIGMGSQKYVNDAKKYLEASSKGVGASQLRRELEERDSKIRTLEQKMDMVLAENQKLRDQGTGGTELAQLQAMLASIATRPQFPTAGSPPQQFDAQTAQINAVHHTTEVAQTKRKRSRL